MKITEVKTYVLEHTLKRNDVFYYSQGCYDKRTAMIVEITTDDGVSGVGEAFGPAIVNSNIIDQLYRPLLLGRNPLEREVIWEELYNRFRDNGQKGVLIEALSAVDIALWDIAGKSLNLPVCMLLGGYYRDKVRAYASGFYHRKGVDQVEQLIEEATGYMERGFKAIKLKVGFNFGKDMANVKAVRQAIGKDILLMVDANHAYNACNAIKFGRDIEEYSIHWFEEPVPPEDIQGYLEVKHALNIPIAGGEAEFTRFGFKNLISQRAVDIVQPDCCVMGGLSEAKVIAYLANTWNIQCIPHVWGSSVGISAALQFIGALPNFPPSLNPTEPLLELDQTPNLFREKLTVEPPFVLANGYVEIPRRPGLGVKLNRDIIERYNIKKNVISG